MKRFTIGLAIAAIALPTLAAPHFGDGMDRGMWRDLGLTEAQQNQLQALRDEYRTQRQQARGDVQAKMKTLLTQDTFDEQAVRDLLSAQPQPNIERRVAHARHQHAMMQVLTPEQQTAFFDAMHKKHDKQGKGQRRHHGKKGDCSR